jgi:hypothetical protein
MEQQEKHYVYIFSNTVTPNILKIGKTNKHPEIRAEQLSNQTGAIGKYICEWYMDVIDNNITETLLHYIFKPFHYHREQFKMNKDEAIKIAANSVKELNILLDNYNYEKENIKTIKEGFDALMELNPKDKKVENTINKYNERIKSIEKLKVKN